MNVDYSSFGIGVWKTKPDAIAPDDYKIVFKKDRKLLYQPEECVDSDIFPGNVLEEYDISWHHTFEVIGDLMEQMKTEVQSCSTVDAQHTAQTCSTDDDTLYGDIENTAVRNDVRQSVSSEVNHLLVLPPKTPKGKRTGKGKSTVKNKKGKTATQKLKKTQAASSSFCNPETPIGSLESVLFLNDAAVKSNTERLKSETEDQVEDVFIDDVLITTENFGMRQQIEKAMEQLQMNFEKELEKLKNDLQEKRDKAMEELQQKLDAVKRQEQQNREQQKRQAEINSKAAKNKGAQRATSLHPTCSGKLPASPLCRRLRSAAGVETIQQLPHSARLEAASDEEQHTMKVPELVEYHETLIDQATSVPFNICLSWSSASPKVGAVASKPPPNVTLPPLLEEADEEEDMTANDVTREELTSQECYPVDGDGADSNATSRDGSRKPVSVSPRRSSTEKDILDAAIRRSRDATETLQLISIKSHQEAVVLDKRIPCEATTEAQDDDEFATTEDDSVVSGERSRADRTSLSFNRSRRSNVLVSRKTGRRSVCGGLAAKRRSDAARRKSKRISTHKRNDAHHPLRPPIENEVDAMIGEQSLSPIPGDGDAIPLSAQDKVMTAETPAAATAADEGGARTRPRARKQPPPSVRSNAANRKRKIDSGTSYRTPSSFIGTPTQPKQKRFEVCSTPRESGITVGTSSALRSSQRIRAHNRSTQSSRAKRTPTGGKTPQAVTSTSILNTPLRGASNLMAYKSFITRNQTPDKASKEKELAEQKRKIEEKQVRDEERRKERERLKKLQQEEASRKRLERVERCNQRREERQREQQRKFAENKDAWDKRVNENVHRARDQRRVKESEKMKKVVEKQEKAATIRNKEEEYRQRKLQEQEAERERRIEQHKREKQAEEQRVQGQRRDEELKRAEAEKDKVSQRERELAKQKRNEEKKAKESEEKMRKEGEMRAKAEAKEARRLGRERKRQEQEEEEKKTQEEKKRQEEQHQLEERERKAEKQREMARQKRLEEKKAKQEEEKRQKKEKQEEERCQREQARLKALEEKNAKLEEEKKAMEERERQRLQGQSSETQDVQVLLSRCESLELEASEQKVTTSAAAAASSFNSTFTRAPTATSNLDSTFTKPTATSNLNSTFTRAPDGVLSTPTPAPRMNPLPALNSTYTRQNEVSCYDMTPRGPDKPMAPSTAENYNIDDYESGDSTDDEDRPKKTIPKWAKGARLRKQIVEHAYSRPDVEVLFTGVLKQSVDLPMIFAGQKLNKRCLKRGSSACWSPVAGVTGNS